MIAAFGSGHFTRKLFSRRLKRFSRFFALRQRAFSRAALILYVARFEVAPPADYDGRREAKVVIIIISLADGAQPPRARRAACDAFSIAGRASLPLFTLTMLADKIASSLPQQFTDCCRHDAPEYVIYHVFSKIMMPFTSF